jgi:nitrate reductase assembly molybdenum cofactor insertion protein NarJ
MIRYYPYAEDRMNKYLQLIKNKDAKGLARMVNPEEEYPVEKAQQIIEKYSTHFDITTLKPTYNKYDKHFFGFELKDEKGNNHQIKVIFGDGLISIRDDFIPPIE